MESPIFVVPFFYVLRLAVHVDMEIFIELDNTFHVPGLLFYGGVVDIELG
jgi:hypothetical protein